MIKLGTRSVLYGAHCFLLHPWFVFVAWWRLYGFPWDLRLWVAFVLHDLGYWGKPNMDGIEGEQHPVWAAKVMRRLFGEEWYGFCKYHSRHLAKKNGHKYSRLCVADKAAMVITPAWLYLPMVRLTREITEYMQMAKQSGKIKTGTQKEWYASVQGYLAGWVEEHKHGKADTWTPQKGRAYS